MLSLTLRLRPRGRMSFRHEMDSSKELLLVDRSVSVSHCITTTSDCGRLTELHKYVRFDSTAMAGIDLRHLKPTGEGE